MRKGEREKGRKGGSEKGRQRAREKGRKSERESGNTTCTLLFVPETQNAHGKRWPHQNLTLLKSLLFCLKTRARNKKMTSLSKIA
jgi:hypothetical protein